MFLTPEEQKTVDSQKPLDATDWRILEVLQTDGRVTFTALARRIGLSTPATTERVRHLEAAGIIRGYRAELDLNRIGRPLLAIVRLSAVGNVLARVSETMQKLPGVLECYRGTGADSFTAKVAVASVEELERLIDQLTPYGTTSTSIVLSVPVPSRPISRPPPSARQRP